MSDSKDVQHEFINFQQRWLRELLAGAPWLVREKYRVEEERFLIERGAVLAVPDDDAPHAPLAWLPRGNCVSPEIKKKLRESATRRALKVLEKEKSADSE